MNRKLEKVLDEIQRTEEKIAAWKNHLEELSVFKKQLEDEEIIKSIRSMKLPSRELISLLENIQNGNTVINTVGKAAGEEDIKTECGDGETGTEADGKGGEKE